MAKYKIIPSSRTIVQSPISIGHKAEKGVEAIEFDLTAWVETYGSGTLTVIMRRWGDAIPYPIALEIDENNKATWVLSDTDTAKAGMAYAQLNYIVGDEVVKKSDIYTFRVMDSLTGEGDPPEAYESWLEHLTHFAAEAMAEVLDIEGIVTDKTLTVDGGIADAKAAGDALALKADKSTTYTKAEVDHMIEDVEIETDTTLSVFGAPADAKKTGDELSALNESLGDVRADLSESIGDLKSAIDDVESKIGANINLAPLVTTLGYIKADGIGINEYSGYSHSDYIRVLTGDVITYALRAPNNMPMVAVYDTSKVYSSSASVIGTGGGVAGTLTIASSGYIRISTKDTNNICSLKRNGLVIDVADLQSSVTSLANRTTTAENNISELQGDTHTTKLDMFSVLSNDDLDGYLKANGTYAEYTGYKTTSVGVKLESGETVTYSLKILSSTLPILCVYSDEDCTTLTDSVLGVANEYVTGTYTAQSDCYVRFCRYVTATDSYVIFNEVIPDNVRITIDEAMPPKRNLKVAIFGDSIFGNDGQIVNFLAEYTYDFANVYNCAFGGTSISNRVDTSSPYYWFDGESLWTAITTGTTTNQDANINSLSQKSRNHWTRIKSLNFSDIDLIVLAYGTNDYTQGKSISTINSAYNSVFNMIRTTFPTTRILVFSPIWRLISYDYDTSEYIDSDTKTYAAGVTLREIANGIIANCKDQRISVYDGYSNVPVCLANVPTYFDNVTVDGDADSQAGIEVPAGSGQYYSGVHLNETGNKMYSEIVHGTTMSIF